MALLSLLSRYLSLSGRQSPAPGGVPRPLVWSSRTYGPDGPWQAVEIAYGTPAQKMDVYPGGAWESLFLAPEICDHPQSMPTCFALDAGVYNASGSSTAYQVVEGGFVENATFVGTQTLYGDALYYLDTMTLYGDAIHQPYIFPNFSSMIVSAGVRSLPNGTNYTAAVGNLALGAELINQTWPKGDGYTNGSLLTGYLYSQSVIPSNSYGLHIGSAALKIPGSLYVGGYDQLRVVGPVSGQNYGQSNLPIGLLDIGIGVAVGESPFNFTSKTGLLAQGNSTLFPRVAVDVDPKEPYLYLPVSTCQAIAAELPVTYRPDLGIYVWNTDDPLYERIVRSPAYLAFTFDANNSVTTNFTVNVPFQLLNLTLTEPLAHEPTPYFPCALPSLTSYRLGRSFLQAAFISVNWGQFYNGSWFLAQAPGPNIAPAPNVVNIGPLDTALAPSANTWMDSWQGVWEPIAADGSQSTSTPSAGNGANGSNNTASESPDRTTVIAGVTVGAVVLLITLAVATLFIVRANKKNRTQPLPKLRTPQRSTTESSKFSRIRSRLGLLEHMGRYHVAPPPELHSSTAPQELPGMTLSLPPTQLVELDTEPIQPQNRPSSTFKGNLNLI